MSKFLTYLLYIEISIFFFTYSENNLINKDSHARTNAYDIHTLVAPSSYSVECCEGIKDTEERVEYVYIKLFENLFCKIYKFEMVIKAFS